jgi:2-oxoisovalerate dehydrogenase E1 component
MVTTFSEEKNLSRSKKNGLSRHILENSYRLMATAKAMTDIYEENFKFASKYVHATSRGHEAIQLAVGQQLTPEDFAYPYYRDDSMLLGMGLRPFDLMLQLMAKRDDPFSAGRSYYCHPSLRDERYPKIPHQSSATGMQAIPATGAAMGLWYKEKMVHFKTGRKTTLVNLDNPYPYHYEVEVPNETGQPQNAPLVLCSLGDASITEGEVSEAFQMTILKKLPIIYLVQDNGWDISASADEFRVADAAEYAKGFPGMKVYSIDGSDFNLCWTTVEEAMAHVRARKGPVMLHAKVPLLNHHTSGVRKEWYRDDLLEQSQRDPYQKLRDLLKKSGVSEERLLEIEENVAKIVKNDFESAKAAEDPRPSDLYTHDFAPTPITLERGEREPQGKEAKVMVDCALFAIEELMTKHPECLLYGQDVGKRLGGVFREAATLAQKFGDHRVFNTPIQEAFIIGSTAGMSAVGLKPIVEVQFADYIWPGLNQLFTEVSRSCYLSNGKWPVSCIIRVPVGAYGSGGPYHSSSVETAVCSIRGIKIAYPSNGADLKGLLKSAYYDPNPVLIFEHKGLYWSKVAGTEAARTTEPDADYMIPFGIARTVLQADVAQVEMGSSIGIVTYGMGVHWSLNAAKNFTGQVELLDLRTLSPLDEISMYRLAQKHGKVLIVTEEQVNGSFAQTLAARISEHCFADLDAPVRTVGSADMPAIPLNNILEQEMIPSSEKIRAAIKSLLAY